MIVRLVWVVIPLVLFSIVGMQESFAEETTENISNEIPELFIYDNDTESATLPPERNLHKFAIRHEFAKVNMDAFDSDPILFNLFGESIVVNKHSVVNSIWTGTIDDPNYVNVYLAMHNGKFTGTLDYAGNSFSIMPLTQNDLYIIQEIDRSQYNDEPDGWYENAVTNNNTFDYNSMVLLIIIVLIIGIITSVLYYKKRRHDKL